MMALICDSWENFWREVLSPWGEIKTFSDGVTLAYYLQHGGPCDLAVVAVDGADGMNYCDYARHIRPGVRVLWVTQDADFAPRSQRMGADGFLVKPLPRGEPENALHRILGPPGSAGGPHAKPIGKGESPCPRRDPSGGRSLLSHIFIWRRSDEAHKKKLETVCRCAALRRADDFHGFADGIRRRSRHRQGDTACGRRNGRKHQRRAGQQRLFRNLSAEQRRKRRISYRP